jgi:hypothetical protein
VDVAHQRAEAAFAFAGEQRDAEIERFLKVGGELGHGDAARHMEPADHDRQSGGAELPREIERTRVLVRLHADQPDETSAGRADLRDDGFDADDGVALVERIDLDIDVGPEHALCRAVREQAVNAREAVGGNGRAPPLDDVAVGVVMRRLDQNNLEDAVSHAQPPRRPEGTFDRQSHSNATGANTQTSQWGRAARPKKDTVSSTQIHISAKQDSQPARIKSPASAELTAPQATRRL